jgi:hypothetical protein
MKVFVLARSFPGDNYTSFWDGARHEWSCLSAATVFTEKEKASYYRVPIRHSLSSPITGYNGQVILESTGNTYYVPEDGEWTELPMPLRLRTPEEMMAEQDRRYEEDRLADEKWQAEEARDSYVSRDDRSYTAQIDTWEP